VDRPLAGQANLLAAASSFCLGVLLPVALTPASKSSPLILSLSAALALAAVVVSGHFGALKDRVSDLATTPAASLSLAMIVLMAASVLWAHHPASSANQLVQFLIPLLAGLVICLTFPLIAPGGRLNWWLVGAAAAGLIVALDINSGLKLREVTGGRQVTYSYNRALVTLVVLIWPLLALIVARQKPWLAVCLLAVVAGVYAGESQTAVLGLVAGLAVFPMAWYLPKLTRWIGVVGVLAVLAASPFFGTLSSKALGAGFHKTLEAAHSDDRVKIWLSFEAATLKRPIFGNGFGSTLNMQNAPVAQEIAPERVTLLGASHPHNAFLQLWAELGVVGAGLAAALFLLLFRAIGRMPVLLQPFVLTWVAVASAIALVSHGAWQAWWVAALAASAAGFLAVARELQTHPAPHSGQVVNSSH
jgi:exopolysaccharide production protein ExoQ